MADGASAAAAPAQAVSADFDKEQFRQRIEVKALRVPAKQCHHYMKLLAP